MAWNRSSEVANGYIHFPSTIGWKDIPSTFSCIDSFCQQFFIKGCKLNAEELKKRLPNICPLCGAIMKEGVCENE